MMLRRRSLRVLAIVLVVLALATVAVVWLRRSRSPEAVRLLPEADAVVYFDVKTLRTLGAFSEGKISREPEYDEFVRETGFQFERDLNEAAFAIHAAKGPTPPDAPLGTDARFSEIFIGKFDVARAHAYFKKVAKSIERYRDVDIYLIPRGGWDSRVALLGIDHAAVSTAESPQAMHMMIDHYRAGALHTAGPSVLGNFRERIPLGSVMWGIARLSDGTGLGIAVPPMAANLAGTTVVASVRPMFGGAHLRVEDVTPDAERAQRITEGGNTMLAMFKQLEEGSSSGPDEDVKTMFESIKVQQEDRSAVLTATVPPGFLKKITSEPPALAPQPEPAPTPTAAPKKRRTK